MIFDDNKSLFKYVSLNKYDIENLKNGVLFLRTASRFNDKFDSLPLYSKQYFNNRLDMEMASGKWNHYLLAYQGKNEEEKRKIVGHLLRSSIDSSNQDSVFISCFSDNCHSNVMWAHYGEIYQGAVFEYKVRDLLHAAQNHLLDLKRANLFNFSNDVLMNTPIIDKVNYISDRFDMTEDFQKAEKFINRYGRQDDFSDPEYFRIALTEFQYHDRMRKIFFSKTNEWSYESEWRLVIPNHNKDKGTEKDDIGKQQFITVKPVSVILGQSTPAFKVQEVIRTCVDQGISLFGSGPDYFSRKCEILVEPLHQNFINHFLLSAK